MIALYSYNTIHGNNNGVVYSYSELYKKTFSPLDHEIVILDGVKYADTYPAAKDQIRQQAIRYSSIRSDISMSLSDIITIQSYFMKYAKRYGLMNEFRREGIL